MTDASPSRAGTAAVDGAHPIAESDPNAQDPYAAVATSDRAAAEPSGEPNADASRRRGWHERASTRVLASVGIVGIATLLGAVLVSQNVAGWIVGLVIGLMSVAIAGRLWSTQQA